MGRIHNHGPGCGKGVVDRPVQSRFQLRPGALNTSIPPELLPQVVAGDHRGTERFSESGSQCGLSTARWADQQVPCQKLMPLQKAMPV